MMSTTDDTGAAATSAERSALLEACSRDGFALRSAPPNLKHDREVVEVAIKQCPMALRCASTALQHDRDLILIAVSGHGYMLFQVPLVLRDDLDIVLAACTQSGDSLRAASARLRSHKVMMDGWWHG
jgi:hypothetical protein